VIGGWRKLHYDELHDLYSFSIVIRMIKSRSMRWRGEKECIQGFDGKPEGKRP
jgi:hypothetical protein